VRARETSTALHVGRWCPETGEEVEVTVDARGTWCRADRECGIEAGWEDVHALANGRPFRLSRAEEDWAAERLSDELEQ
jgi:hypothetical protein